MSFSPFHEVTMYQARCTECGVVETDYGEYSAWSDKDAPIDMVVDYHEWFRRDGSGGIDVLLCPSCQRCEVCGAEQAYPNDDHMVCEDHEDHDFGGESR